MRQERNYQKLWVESFQDEVAKWFNVPAGHMSNNDFLFIMALGKCLEESQIAYDFCINSHGSCV